jgi:hypothetical protein
VTDIVSWNSYAVANDVTDPPGSVYRATRAGARFRPLQWENILGLRNSHEIVKIVGGFCSEMRHLRLASTVTIRALWTSPGTTV